MGVRFSAPFSHFLVHFHPGILTSDHEKVFGHCGKQVYRNTDDLVVKSRSATEAKKAAPYRGKSCLLRDNKPLKFLKTILFEFSFTLLFYFSFDYNNLIIRGSILPNAMGKRYKYNFYRPSYFFLANFAWFLYVEMVCGCAVVAEVECPAPENPTNGRAIYTRQAYNSVVSYECNYGYSLVGDSTRRCGADRRWSGHKPACQEINCGDPGPLYNGWLENLEGGTLLGASVIFRCKEGMRLEGNASSVCQIDGHWRYPTPRCMGEPRAESYPSFRENGILAPCVVPKIINGTVWPRGVMSNSTDDPLTMSTDGAQTVPHGEQLMVRCEPRYEFLNNGTPVLCNNGTWTQIPKCQPESNKVLCVARCKRMPRVPRNGYVIAPKTDHGMRARFACRDGFTLRGQDVTECSYGNWSGEIPQCEEVYCPFPGYVENGKVMLVGNMGLYDYRPYVRKVTNNKQIMYDCDRGYVLAEGPPGATCLSGDWSPKQLPRCVPGKHPRLRWSRSVRQRRAALYAARLRALSSWSSEGSR
ncbi:hypothetical protein FOCC_FOCC006082 [Frankliniella occidentalis]|nr:hypothetical protein FOCC_FOCC006082 [Frankliniella occidentalis]